jgi:hypothetical protein
MKPNEQILNELYAEMVQALRDKLTSDECPVSAISAAIQLLRDNQIQCDPDEIGNPTAVGEKLNLLPFPAEGAN